MTLDQLHAELEAEGGIPASSSAAYHQPFTTSEVQPAPMTAYPFLGLMLARSFLLPATVAIADNATSPRAWSKTTVLPSERDLDSRWNNRIDASRPPVGQILPQPDQRAIYDYERSDPAVVSPRMWSKTTILPSEHDLDGRWNNRSAITLP